MSSALGRVFHRKALALFLAFLGIHSQAAPEYTVIYCRESTES